MKFALFQTASGSPILIGEHGIIIEPETETGRSIITLPHKERDGKSKIIVRERFEDICTSLEVSLIDMPEIVAAVDHVHEEVIAKITSAERYTEVPWGPPVGAEIITDDVGNDYSEVIERTVDTSESQLPPKRGRKKK